MSGTGSSPSVSRTKPRRLTPTATARPPPHWRARASAPPPEPRCVGNRELAVGVKDKTTAPDANGYGQAASALAGTVQVVAPLVLSCPAVTQRTVTYGTTVTWSGISSSGGTPGTIQYAMFRQLTGNASNPWLPNPPAWQSNTAFSWTPTASDLGTWQFHVITKDVNTPADPGLSSNCNLGQPVVVSPLTLSVTGTPASRPHDDSRALSWTATASGGVSGTYQHAFFRRRTGPTAWTPRRGSPRRAPPPPPAPPPAPPPPAAASRGPTSTRSPAAAPAPPPGPPA